MKLVIIYGPPGVGKLTVGRELAMLTGFKLFHNHLTVDLVAAVFDFKTCPFIDLRERIWLLVFDRAIEEGVEGVIFTFAPDRTVRADFIQDVINRVERAGGAAHPVHLGCDLEELFRRVQEPSRSNKLQSAEHLRESLKTYAAKLPPLDRDPLTIDNTHLPPAAAAAKIAWRLGLTLSPLRMCGEGAGR